MFFHKMNNNINVLIGTYRPEKNQLDWILGVNPKRNYMLYNIRRNADLFSNRNGGYHNYKDVNLLVLYNYRDLASAPVLYRILASAEATEQQMANLKYPDPKGSYALYQIEELGTLSNFPIQEYVSTEKDFEPVLAPFDTLEEGIRNSISILSQKAQSQKKIDIVAEVEKINKWDKSIPVEENMYYWKGKPIVHKGNLPQSDKPLVVELFCGCGGTSVGFEMAGYQIALGCDIHRFSVETFRLNHKGVSTILGDIHDVKTDDVLQLLNGRQVDVLIGGIPCQGFSLNNRKRHADDKRNQLYKEFLRFVEVLKPRAILLENVSGMKSTGDIVSEIEKSLSEAGGMEVKSKLLYAPDYGVPQSRLRLVFVGVKGKKFDFESIEKTNGEGTGKPYNTVWDAIGDLPVLAANEESSKYTMRPQTEYQILMRGDVPSGKLTNHQAPNHPQDVIDMIHNTKEGEPLYEKYHQRIRLSRTELSPTQVSGGIRPSFQFGHPTQDRGLTIRERCRLQSFPDNFYVYGGIVQGRVQTGNAVPPLLAKAIALAIKKYL